MLRPERANAIHCSSCSLTTQAQLSHPKPTTSVTLHRPSSSAHDDDLLCDPCALLSTPGVPVEPPHPAQRSSQPWSTSVHDVSSRRIEREFMTVDTPNTEKGGPSGDPTAGGTPQSGQPASKPPSPIIPALVVISLALVSGLLVWWIMRKLRRSRRYAPAMGLAELNSDRPVLWDVKVGQAIVATKINETGWNRLQVRFPLEL
ncbi:hypothetical protein C8Q73DRAFT_200183 [Cubamyces lactineus]|nr:hypothetical protein C8Q73DRAFT_200183 [Cubamyces lactineus]